MTGVESDYDVDYPRPLEHLGSYLPCPFWVGLYLQGLDLPALEVEGAYHAVMDQDHSGLGKIGVTLDFGHDGVKVHPLSFLFGS